MNWTHAPVALEGWYIVAKRTRTCGWRLSMQYLVLGEDGYVRSKTIIEAPRMDQIEGESQ